jgi:hypothetical protein
MQIPANLARSFNKAVSNPENIQTNGHVNWNFVDADVYMDVGPKNNQSNVLHYKMFDFLADAFEKANGKQIQGKEATLGVFSEYAEEGLQ